MISVDWSWLEKINLFQVAVVIVALFVIARMLLRFWPWLRKIVALGDALAQLPTFIERTDATLKMQDLKIEEIHHEVNYNNGTSAKDAIARVELGVKSLHAKVDATRAALEAEDAKLRKDLEDTRDRAPIKRAPRKPKTIPPKEQA